MSISLNEKYPEGDYPSDGYSSSGVVFRRGIGSFRTRTCICGARFEGTVAQEAEFIEAHKNHEPTYCECCGREF